MEGAVKMSLRGGDSVDLKLDYGTWGDGSARNQIMLGAHEKDGDRDTLVWLDVGDARVFAATVLAMVAEAQRAENCEM